MECVSIYSKITTSVQTQYDHCILSGLNYTARSSVDPMIYARRASGLLHALCGDDEFTDSAFVDDAFVGSDRITPVRRPVVVMGENTETSNYSIHVRNIIDFRPMHIF